MKKVVTVVEGNDRLSRNVGKDYESKQEEANM
jgi:hypothetical protein